MYTVRPILKDFILWTLLMPLFLLEGKALSRFLDEFALNNPENRNQIIAEIYDYREGNDNNIDIQYRFKLEGNPQQYSAFDDFLGKRYNLWRPISLETWEAIKESRVIEVYYLKENPWINEPVDVAGVPLLDSFAGWAVILIYDLYWVYETYHIFKNYRRSQRDSEEGREKKYRYWKSQELYKI